MKKIILCLIILISYSSTIQAQPNRPKTEKLVCQVLEENAISVYRYIKEKEASPVGQIETERDAKLFYQNEIVSFFQIYTSYANNGQLIAQSQFDSKAKMVLSFYRMIIEDPTMTSFVSIIYDKSKTKLRKNEREVKKRVQKYCKTDSFKKEVNKYF
ncbi:hypothetical protein QJU23_01650 [Pasteurella atlantica]|uniref:Uncharacterized protein n=2 Tax=Pasteurellaceae TaxID=712 RepID=A0ACC6HJZ4_9PAST|nr:hypothetical protein [Pasteurella atlantica]MDP8051128.1 hypothetical protein [Pasteurella atlantica]MDP8104424.1 hypothetical protein [Pasteurella atlantica]MDP8147784.1 hypothetical protein [Pasteurella atlantica]